MVLKLLALVLCVIKRLRCVTIFSFLDLRSMSECGFKLSCACRCSLAVIKSVAALES